MIDEISLTIIVIYVLLPVLLLSAPFLLCFIRLLNETLLDKQWRVGERSPAEQAALLDWEASIRDFHHRRAPQCFPPEAAKRQPETGIRLNGPSAFQERQRFF
jgi:hypothetical protein